MGSQSGAEKGPAESSWDGFWVSFTPGFTDTLLNMFSWARIKVEPTTVHVHLLCCCLLQVASSKCVSVNPWATAHRSSPSLGLSRPGCWSGVLSSKLQQRRGSSDKSVCLIATRFAFHTSSLRHGYQANCWRWVPLCLILPTCAEIDG